MSLLNLFLSVFFLRVSYVVDETSSAPAFADRAGQVNLEFAGPFWAWKLTHGRSWIPSVLRKRYATLASHTFSKPVLIYG